MEKQNVYVSLSDFDHYHNPIGNRSVIRSICFTDDFSVAGKLATSSSPVELVSLLIVIENR